MLWKVKWRTFSINRRVHESKIQYMKTKKGNKVEPDQKQGSRELKEKYRKLCSRMDGIQ